MKGNNRQEPILDMNRLGAMISRPEDYAPPDIRRADDAAVKQVETFGELPTKELDEIVRAAREELAALEREAQVVRDLYAKHTTRIAEDIKRLREGVALSMKTMNVLREQCLALNGTPEASEQAEASI